MGVIGLIDQLKNFKLKLKAKYLVPLIIFFIISLIIVSSSTDIKPWVKWNYEGLEEKSTYPKLKKVLDKINSTPTDGRVDIEYANYNYFGTPRVFETSPIFTGKPVIEALLVESSLTFPFHYYIQREITKEAWWPTFPLKIPKQRSI